MLRFMINRARSFQYALHGVFLMLRNEHNAWIHLMATIVVVSAGFYFKITNSEWCWIALAVVSVWTAEALNTAIELLADASIPNFHPTIKKAKDVAAGGVLITCIGSVVIAALVFGQHLIALAAKIK